MTDAVEAHPSAHERPTWRISFRDLVLTVLGLSLLALVAGRYVYQRYGRYTPLALTHVPVEMRYRARVDFGDAPRMTAIAPLLSALDPRNTRRAALARGLGLPAAETVRELAFGSGTDPRDFVVVLGLAAQAKTGMPAAMALCNELAAEGIRSEPTSRGCVLAGGPLIAGTPDGAVVIASRKGLVEPLLEAPDIGDRLGFSGPSPRGAAPEPRELAGEAADLAGRVRLLAPDRRPSAPTNL